MAPQCGVCNEQDSKYKCPICELRYCSIPCYKTHKTTHVDDQTSDNAKADGQEKRLPLDRPGTTQRVPKVDFSGFENDQDFQRLLSRYPKLKHQLQLAYGLTLEPGPDEGFTWSRRDWLDDDRISTRGAFRGRSRGRGRGGRARGRGGRFMPEMPHDERQRGPWSQEKGDKQALGIVHRMKTGREEEMVEGMAEFIELCQIKFGGERPAKSTSALFYAETAVNKLLRRLMIHSAAIRWAPELFESTTMDPASSEYYYDAMVRLGSMNADKRSHPVRLMTLRVKAGRPCYQDVLK